MLIVVVGSVVGDFVLDTRSGGSRITATERHTINQVAAIHIALNTAGESKMEK